MKITYSFLPTQFPRCLVSSFSLVLFLPFQPTNWLPNRHVAGPELPPQIPVCLQPAEGCEDPTASAQRCGEAGFQLRPHAPPAGYAPVHAGDDCHEPLPAGLQGSGAGRHPGPSHAGLIGAREETKLVSGGEEDGATTYQW